MTSLESPKAEGDCFTNGKRRIATAKDCGTRWSMAAPGERFRCALCGHRFKVGDGWRWQYAQGRGVEIDGKRYGVCNFFTCDVCDGPDVIDRWIALHAEYYGTERFWWFRDKP